MTETTKQLPATIPHEPVVRQKLWPVWLIALIALVIALALALWNWQQWNDQKSVQQALTDLQQSTTHLQSLYGDRDNQQGQRLQALEEKLSAQRELIATQRRQIDHNAQALLEAGNRTRTDWLLAEAEYLLRIANQRLLVEKDIRGAFSALKSADDVLKESDDIGVYPVRQQLAREILALKGISDVDRTGLYLKLEAAINSIHQLTDQALINEQAPGFVSDTGEQAEPAGQPGLLARTWSRLKTTLMQIVVVRRMDEPVKPLLSPDQSAYARLNLQLMLEEAEMAVLRGNQALYQRALTKARDTIEDWYDAGNPQVAALSETLTELATRDVDPALPDISKSLGLLKARLAGRLASGDNAENGANTGKTRGGDDS